MSYVTPKPANAYPWYLRLFYAFQKKRTGKVSIPTQVWGRQPRLLRCFLALFRALERKSSPIPPVLRALITVRISQINHCAYCVDFNSMRVLRHPEGAAKLAALASYAKSPGMTAEEKAALAYAEVVTHSERQVEPHHMEALRAHYDDDAIVELTALIAFQNLSSKFNAALDLPSQGFCQIPTSQPKPPVQ